MNLDNAAKSYMVPKGNAVLYTVNLERVVINLIHGWTTEKGNWYRNIPAVIWA